MSVPGKMIKTSGKLVGNTVEYGIKFTGELIGIIAESRGNEKLARGSRRIGRITGHILGGATRLSTRVLGNVVDKVIEAGSESVKYVAENAVKTETRMYGESEKFYEHSILVEAEYRIE